jgi:hypothetical protein
VPRKLALSLAAAATLVIPGHAAAAPCPPLGTPFWADYAGHHAPIVPRPGLVLVVSSGTEIPAQMRAAGAKTLFYDLNFNRRVGTPSAPYDPATMVERADRLYDYVVPIVGCDTPVIALNELFGAQTATPWSATNAQYRANVIALVRQLAARGARPYISIANPPYMGGEAADWWREASRHAVLLRQVFFTSPSARGLHKMGALRASRSMRNSMRSLVRRFAEIGVPPSRVALELKFHSGPTLGGRAGLKPREAWFEIVKWQALAAKHIAREQKVDSIWSWGWATFSQAGEDPDKAAAACVWLWTRDASLCDAPAAAGPRFNTSRTEGQLVLPRGVRCSFLEGNLTASAAGRLARVTRDLNAARSALLERIVLRGHVPLAPHAVETAERALIRMRYGGSVRRYLRALRGARATRAEARLVIGDELRRRIVESRFRVRAPRAREVARFYAAHPFVPLAEVEAVPLAPWQARPRATLALGALPLPQVRPAIAAALEAWSRDHAYTAWLVKKERAALDHATCVRDELPQVERVDLGAFLPFLR